METRGTEWTWKSIKVEAPQVLIFSRFRASCAEAEPSRVLSTVCHFFFFSKQIIQQKSSILRTICGCIFFELRLPPVWRMIWIGGVRELVRDAGVTARCRGEAENVCTGAVAPPTGGLLNRLFGERRIDLTQAWIMMPRMSCRRRTLLRVSETALCYSETQHRHLERAYRIPLYLSWLLLLCYCIIFLNTSTSFFPVLQKTLQTGQNTSCSWMTLVNNQL